MRFRERSLLAAEHQLSRARNDGQIPRLMTAFVTRRSKNDPSAEQHMLFLPQSEGFRLPSTKINADETAIAALARLHATLGFRFTPDVTVFSSAHGLNNQDNVGNMPSLNTSPIQALILMHCAVERGEAREDHPQSGAQWPALSESWQMAQDIGGLDGHHVRTVVGHVSRLPVVRPLPDTVAEEVQLFTERLFAGHNDQVQF